MTSVSVTDSKVAMEDLETLDPWVSSTSFFLPMTAAATVGACDRC